MFWVPLDIWKIWKVGTIIEEDNWIEETLYIVQWCLSPLQSSYLETSHNSPNCHQLPHHIFLNLIDGLKSRPFQRFFFVLGKARSCGAPNLGCSGAESPRWFDVSQKNYAQEVMHELACYCHEAANHQLPIAVVFWIIWIVSPEECSSLKQNRMQIRCSTHSVILNVMATQYTCSLNGIYHPHWLVQWGCHRSHMCVPIHFPWLPGYISVTQTVLVILTMAGLFLNRPHIYNYFRF